MKIVQMLLGQLANAAEPYDAGDCQLATAASASRPGSKWQLEPELDLSFLDQYVGRIPAFDLSTYNLSPGDLSAGRNQAQDSFPLLSASGSGWDPVPVAPDFVRDQIHDGLTKDMAHLGRVQAVAAPAFDSSDFDLSGAAEQFFPETRPAGSSSNKPTHKQELARRAQRRHRQKAKVSQPGTNIQHHNCRCSLCESVKPTAASQERAEEKEAQLASAAAELSNLKAKNQQLHARNILLERLSEMDQQVRPAFLLQACRLAPMTCAACEWPCHQCRPRMTARSLASMTQRPTRPSSPQSMGPGKACLPKMPAPCSLNSLLHCGP